MYIQTYYINMYILYTCMYVYTFNDDADLMEESKSPLPLRPLEVVAV